MVGEGGEKGKGRTSFFCARRTSETCFFLYSLRKQYKNELGYYTITKMSQQQSSAYLTAFNNHFSEFIDDILSIFPDNRDVLNAKNSLVLLRKSNPKIIVKFWRNYIVRNYQAQIEAGDCDFFLKKDYRLDIESTSSGAAADGIVEAIERFRTPLATLPADELQKCVKYIQNLSKISLLYEP